MNAFKKSCLLVAVVLIFASLAQMMFGSAMAATVRPPPTEPARDINHVFTAPPPSGLVLSFAPSTEYLYGTSQTCTFTITNSSNSIDGAFNNSTASASGTWGSSTSNTWTFTAIQDSALVPSNVTAEFRFYQTGWVNDSFAVEAYNGTSWTTLATFNSTNAPPTTLTTKTYNVTAMFTTTAALNNAQLRFRGVSRASGADTITIYIDEVRLNVYGNPLPGTLSQDHYRIGNDAPLTAMTWMSSVDGRAINLIRGSNFRVRVQVRNTGGQDVSWLPRLDWSTSPTTDFAAVPVTSSSSPFFISDTANYGNGAVISTAYFGTGPGTGVAQNGVAYDAENPVSSNLSLPVGTYTEIEFSIQANNNAAYYGSYYFRLTDNGAAFNTYSVNVTVRIQEQPSATDPHNGYSLVTDKCAACHRSHTASGNFLRKSLTEESLCLTCHNGTGATTNINNQFNMVYKHPVAATSGIHTTNETAASNFSSINRHVECEDCHKPHSRYPGKHELGNNAISPVIALASGLGVTNGAANTSPIYTFQPSVSYEYELCFKCHTSWSGVTSRPYPSYNTTLFLTDQGVEFNPANRATHPVEAPGKNQSTNPNYRQTFVSPITPQSTIYCSDCHGSANAADPAGPHGSNNKSLKAGSTNDAAIVCYKCHRYDVYGGTSPPNASLSRVNHPINSAMADNADNVWGIYCMNCHGGGSPGGIHGTHAGPGQYGTANLGDHFMNGAAITGFTPGTAGINNSGACWTKSSADSVNLCTKAHAGTGFTPNYEY